MSHSLGVRGSLVAWSSSDLEDALMTVVAMSHSELSRFDTLMRARRGQLRVEEAASQFA